MKIWIFVFFITQSNKLAPGISGRFQLNAAISYVKLFMRIICVGFT